MRRPLRWHEPGAGSMEMRRFPAKRAMSGSVAAHLPLRVGGIRAPVEIHTPFEKGRLMSDTADRVKKIVVEHLGVEAEKVTEDASFIDDLGADSLDIVELVMAFEEEFGVEIPDDAAEKISTVSDAIKYIDENKG